MAGRWMTMAEQVEGSEGSGGETKPLHGKTFAFYGEFAVWPRYHGGRPAEVAQRLGVMPRNQQGVTKPTLIN